MYLEKEKSSELRFDEQRGRHNLSTSDSSYEICVIQEVTDTDGKICWVSTVHKPHVSLDRSRTVSNKLGSTCSKMIQYVTPIKWPGKM
ncbi:hypothetical protein TNCV_324961 [Trichonephila clavipes]|nr:hypothetical protein TNCV_324961 [Trichonephila clavipes]